MLLPHQFPYLYKQMKKEETLLGDETGAVGSGELPEIALDALVDIRQQGICPVLRCLGSRCGVEMVCTSLEEGVRPE